MNLRPISFGSDNFILQGKKLSSSQFPIPGHPPTICKYSQSFLKG